MRWNRNATAKTYSKNPTASRSKKKHMGALVKG